MKPEALSRPLHRSCGLTDCFTDTFGFTACGSRACSTCGADEIERIHLNPKRERCLSCGAHQQHREKA